MYKQGDVVEVLSMSDEEIYNSEYLENIGYTHEMRKMQGKTYTVSDYDEDDNIVCIDGLFFHISWVIPISSSAVKYFMEWWIICLMSEMLCM